MPKKGNKLLSSTELRTLRKSSSERSTAFMDQKMRRVCEKRGIRQDLKLGTEREVGV